MTARRMISLVAVAFCEYAPQQRKHKTRESQEHRAPGHAVVAQGRERGRPPRRGRSRNPLGRLEKNPGSPAAQLTSHPKRAKANPAECGLARNGDVPPSRPLAWWRRVEKPCWRAPPYTLAGQEAARGA